MNLVRVYYLDHRFLAANAAQKESKTPITEHLKVHSNGV